MVFLFCLGSLLVSGCDIFVRFGLFFLLFMVDFVCSCFVETFYLVVLTM